MPLLQVTQSQHSPIALIYNDYLCMRWYRGKDCLSDLLDEWEPRSAARRSFTDRAFDAILDLLQQRLIAHY
jgi:hypothetical protein